MHVLTKSAKFLLQQLKVDLKFRELGTIIIFG